MPELPAEMSLCIASPPDREKLVAELFYGHEQWAELNHDSAGGLSLELYLRQDGRPWRLPLEHVLLALKMARQRLEGASEAQVEA